ncbi:MAG: plastocyanin/azurin family copper-binding protein [Gemmatimonadaceae bacterium]
MHRLTYVLAATVMVALQVGCTDAGRVSEPQSVAAASKASRDASDGVRRIEILDACDPTSFDAVFGLGTCIRPGGRNLLDFIGEVAAKGKADAWRFTPENIEARVGQTLVAFNNGGEKHTFTEVKQFGGGLNATLNELSHNTVVAPECNTSTLIAVGESATDHLDEEGTELYQCCIHPWMRTTVTVRGS